MQISQFVLYHGSDTNVKMPVWNSGSRYRDFGQCFYTTYDRATAQDWADKLESLSPVVNKYALNLKHIQGDGGEVGKATPLYLWLCSWHRFIFGHLPSTGYKAIPPGGRQPVCVRTFGKGTWEQDKNTDITPQELLVYSKGYVFKLTNEESSVLRSKNSTIETLFPSSARSTLVFHN